MPLEYQPQSSDLWTIVPVYWDILFLFLFFVVFFPCRDKTCLVTKQTQTNTKQTDQTTNNTFGINARRPKIYPKPSLFLTCLFCKRASTIISSSINKIKRKHNANIISLENYSY